MANWAKKYDCIVVCPTFPNGYQGLMYGSDDQLIGLHTELSKSIKLHEKMFVAGFSGGAQFAHRFALKHTNMVIGCAAHSAGSWATGDLPGDLKVTPTAADSVPIVFSCGMMDTAKSVPESPFTRIDWAHQFEKQLLATHAYYKCGYWPNVGHNASPGSNSLTNELFRLSITGLHAPQLEQVGRLIDPIEVMIRSGNLEKAKAKIIALPSDFSALRNKWDISKLPSSAAAGWHENPQMVAELAKRADAFIAEKVTEFTARVSFAGKAPVPKPLVLRDALESE